MIKIIEIENVKGIHRKTFNLDIFPNKPSLLVAPNGFGKSSLATAFKSMNNRRIILQDDDCYQCNTANLPRIRLQYQKPDNSIINVEATNTTNSISTEFDYFVINNNTKPRGIGSIYGRATASLEIKDIVLIDRIPDRIRFDYSYRDLQERFGSNSKVLPNATAALSNLTLMQKISELYQSLQRANGNRINAQINAVIDQINLQTGSTQILTDWIRDNQLQELKQIDYLNNLGDLINSFDLGYNSESRSYLVAIQLIWMFNQNPDSFKNACVFSNYRLDKQEFDTTLADFNSTWQNIRASETGGKLIVKFPPAISISNGQRDILTFIAMLFKAKRELKKEANILIIDEVFDYLDDANLTAAQYYITNLIKDYSSRGKRLYPLILTHLNPQYFKNFAFSNQKVYFLDASTVQVNPSMTALLRNREHVSIQNDVSKYLLHYDPGVINKRAEFRALGIRELWGEANNFNQYLTDQAQNYLNNQPYDPFAVCGAVRVRIEEIAYNKLQSQQARDTFLAIHKTRSKLEKAEEMGVVSPESHYLLGVIYNEGMHWKDHQDNVSPIAAKLENLVIKKLIRDVLV
jgi:energy-coupling factor transporter ATP-binding protein EcfA2